MNPATSSVIMRDPAISLLIIPHSPITGLESVYIEKLLYKEVILTLNS